MLPLLHKHVVITTALIASLSLTACGSKKDINAAPAGETGKVEAPKDQNNTEDTNGSLGGGLPDPNTSGNDDYLPPLPEPIPKAEEPKKETPKKETPKAQTPKKEEPKKQAPAPNYPPPPTTQPSPVEAPKASTPPSVGVLPVAESSARIPSDYASNDPRSISRDDVPKRTTGGVSAEGMVYTSSATDDLHGFLRARNQRVNAESRRLNLEAAASVQSAKMSVNSATGEAVVTLKVLEGNSLNAYNLSGAISANSASALRVVSSGNGENTTGMRALEGTAKCLDLDGGCENVFVRLQIGSTGSSAILNLVFRTSSADLFFNLPAVGAHSNNPEFIELQDFILNTIRRENTNQKITGVRFASWEVVNGRSGFSVAFKGGNQQLLSFAGPLLAPKSGTNVNLPLALSTTDRDASSRLNYANSIGETKLIANNGLGQVRFNVKMKKQDSYNQDQFAVTVMRKVKPLVELTDANLK